MRDLIAERLYKIFWESVGNTLVKYERAVESEKAAWRAVADEALRVLMP